MIYNTKNIKAIIISLVFGLSLFGFINTSFASEKYLSSTALNTWITKWTSQTKMPFLMGVLATVGKDNTAKSRTVAVREISDKGILFFTQKGSAKVAQIKANNSVSMTILFPDLERQIIFDGIAKPISKEENDKYWKTYPKTAQIRFLAYGPTSGNIIINNDNLNDLVDEYTKEFSKKSPDRPESYVGYIIYPTEIKFYQMNSDKMSDSYIIRNKNNKWELLRVVP